MKNNIRSESVSVEDGNIKINIGMMRLALSPYDAAKLSALLTEKVRSIFPDGTADDVLLQPWRKP